MNRPSTNLLPVPSPTDLSRPFWDGCARGVLLIQTCTSCGYRHSTPQDICRSCHSETLQWDKATGGGEIYSYTVVWRPQIAAFDVPYVVAIVELDEGPYLLTNVIGCDPQTVAVGMAVEVVFEARGDSCLPMVRPTTDRPERVAA